MSKLKNPVGRSTDEWAGRSADTWPPPEAVQLRILLRQGGKCTITGHKFAPGDAKQLDHIVALADWTISWALPGSMPPQKPTLVCN